MVQCDHFGAVRIDVESFVSPCFPSVSLVLARVIVQAMPSRRDWF